MTDHDSDSNSDDGTAIGDAEYLFQNVALGQMRRFEPHGIIPDQQLARNYKDSLDLDFLDSQQLNRQRHMDQYRNNLTVFSDQFQLYLVGIKSTIGVYEWDTISGMPCEDAKYNIQTAPENFVNLNLNNITASPFTINFMKLSRLRDQEVVVVATDDGRVLCWKLRDIYERISDCSLRYHGNYISTWFHLHVEQSAWGIDVDENRQLIAISDNSRKVTVFDVGPLLDGSGEPLSVLVTPRLMHNVPDVAFVTVEDEFYDPEVVHVAAVSVKNEVAFWELYLGEKKRAHVEAYSPFDDSNAEDNEFEEDELFVGNNRPFEQFSCKPFPDGVWKYRENLNDQAWTITVFKETDFKKVSSFGEAMGNPEITQEQMIERLENENKRLGFEEHRGLFPASRFAYNHITGVYLGSLASGEEYPEADLPAIVRNKEAKKRQYINNHHEQYIANPPFKNQFFVVSGAIALSLHRVEDFYGNAHRSNVFGWSSGPRGFSMDRMSIVCPIRELSAVIYASQVGVLSIYRLVRHQGVYCLRQEYLFPESYYTIYRSERMLCGVTTAKIKRGHYRIFVLFWDGIMNTYDLKRKPNSEDIDTIQL